MSPFGAIALVALGILLIAGENWLTLAVESPGLTSILINLWVVTNTYILGLCLILIGAIFGILDRRARV